MFQILNALNSKDVPQIMLNSKSVETFEKKMKIFLFNFNADKIYLYTTHALLCKVFKENTSIILGQIGKRLAILLTLNFFALYIRIYQFSLLRTWVRYKSSGPVSRSL